MELYLVQHGEAKLKAEDPERPLTDRGRREVERVAAMLQQLGIRVGRIHHSGKLRAHQTAVLLAAALTPGRSPETMDGLAPNDDPATAAAAVTASTEPLMLVGHLPHLSRLASHLVTGDAEHAIIAFENAGTVCLSSEDGGWRIRWILTPDVVAGT